MLRQSLLITASLTLAACAGVPDLAQPPVLDAPGEFRSEPEQALPAPGDWVAGFGDPALTALIAEALAANPTVEAAEASLAAARASARAAGASRLPSVEASSGASASDTPTGSRETYSLGLNLSWQVDVWGRLTDQARAGALGAEAAAADLYGARLTIAGATVKSWFALIEAREQTELAQRDVDTRTRQLEIVQRRFERGVARSSDVRTARSALAISQATLASRERFEAASARALEALLGRYPGNTISHAGSLPQLAPLPEPGTPQTLIERRPDIVAAEARLAAAGYSASAARKALYPGLSIGGGASNQVSDAGDLLDPDFLVETVSASILAPIFRGGALRAERDRTEAVARQLAARYVDTALTALREAEDAIHADHTLEQRVEALIVAQSEARAALDLVERQYASGVATIFELIDAQTRLINAEAQLITARRERAANRVDLHLAIAGDFAAGGGITGASN
ncbi:efflux transporter outer membrane subunit [Marinicauda algicola]|uniref:Efflux transporter outer membrane subunit n=1 Tax=Marinicauda algicola TaxID=2029849 RepID=A0A4S2GY52_9PROT|nr:efflux transporter outer membrane subunit [Marinicauda algicola]TGY88107.1 efflux transporter outer membrane subunit [Marinicauda algicola]